jgi:membrane-associated phospholipid phosphatase
MGERFFVGARLDLRQRMLITVILLMVSLGYLPLNRLMTGGTTVEIWLDRLVPFWPAWIIPYLLAIVWWIVAGIWAFWSMRDTLYLAFASSWILACLIGFCIFIFYPTYMIRPSFSGDGWAEAIVRYVYEHDRTYNAFPSMHLWITVTITLYWSYWKPKWRVWMWGATIVVALSTVLSGQHWVMDVVGGTFLALACYYLGPAVAALVLPVATRSSMRPPSVDF